MIRKLLALSLLAVPIALLCTSASAAKPGQGPDLTAGADLGQVQFVSALDAAWVRVVHSGQYQDIINDPAHASTVNEQGVGGVLPVEHVLDHADCLPNPDVTHYPGELGAVKDAADAVGEAQVSSQGLFHCCPVEFREALPRYTVAGCACLTSCAPGQAAAARWRYGTGCDPPREPGCPG